MMITIVLTVLASALVSGVPLNVNTRIIGGQIAAPAAYPYTVSLRAFALGYEDLHYCGGSIISTKTILTAGHCVDWLPATSIEVVFGSNQLDCKGTRYRAARTLLHPSYNDTVFTDDIGLVFVAKNFEYGPTVQVIAPEWAIIGAGVPVETMGWGRPVQNNTAPSNDLRFFKENTISRADCNSRLNGIMRPIEENELCTISPVGVGVCNNDAGGPIVYEGRQVGIIALGLGCATENPDIAVRVSSFKTWIEQNTIQ